MEVKDAERTPIAKPVPSRPSCSNFSSFSELLAGAIDSPPPSPRPETAFGAIRPKTVRLKPASDNAPVCIIPPQAEASGAAVIGPSEKVLVYKPLAKVVSKRTLTVLANLGNSSISQQQASVGAEAGEEPLNQLMYPFNYHGDSERAKAKKTSKRGNENMEDDHKSFPHTSIADRPSYDGYNWRKYGQKQVKGSEYPRSYYKCTHPNCSVKKKVERTLDGQIAEIVYKGEHNHAKPQPSKRNTVGGGPGEEFASDETGQETNRLGTKNEGVTENRNEVGFCSQSNYRGKGLLSDGPVFPGDIEAFLGAPEAYHGLIGDHEEGYKVLDLENDKPKRKRRKHENESAEALQEPRAATQNVADTEIAGDGFRWRKYGQKVVKGNPYPRSYYKCTNLKCNVRKHVERVSDDPTAFITTYEGRHNHEMPVKNTNPAEPDSHPVTSKNKP